MTTSNSLPISNERGEAPHGPVEHPIAEHRATVVGKDQDSRLILEVCAELDIAAILVAKREIERKLCIQLLIDPYLVDNIGSIFWAYPGSCDPRPRSSSATRRTAIEPGRLPASEGESSGN